MPKHTAHQCLIAVIFSGLLISVANSHRLVADPEPAGASTNAPINAVSETNAPVVPDAQTQEMIRQAIEQIRHEATLVSTQFLEQTSRNVEIVAHRLDETLKTRLGVIEQSLNEQRRRELEAMQNSNRTLLLIAGIFGVVGVLGILIAAAIIVRAMNRLSEVALALPAGHGLTSAVLGAGDVSSAGQTQLDQASIRFLGAIERLEKRIQELELTTQSNDVDVEHRTVDGELKAVASNTVLAPFTDGKAAGKDFHPAALTSERIDDMDPTAQASMLIGKGQALMNLGQAEEALNCFENAVRLDPANADALVKKGMALEKLQKIEEALASYDKAIATDSSLTLAYLYKGAVCNRLQRFREALECYEKALKTEQKPVPS